MKNKLFFFILLQLLSLNAYSIGEKKLFFLIIGNSHYEKDINCSFLHDIPEAQSSASELYNTLSKYGKGILLNSKESEKISSETILKKIAELFKMTTIDSNTIFLIYYCGHGKSNYDGNLAFVPGNVCMDLALNNQKDFYKSLIPINHIESEWTNLVFGVQSSPNLDLFSGISLIVNAYNGLKDRNYNFENDKINEKDFTDVVRSLDSLRIPAIKELPKLILLSDCCYDSQGLGKKNDFNSYEGSILEYEIRRTTADSIKANELINDVNIKSLDSTLGKDKSLWFIMEAMKNTYLQCGNKLITATNYGNTAQSIKHPFKKNMEIGPIARRLLLFFKHNPDEFNMYNFLNCFSNKNFDSKTDSFFFENNSKLGTVESNTYLDSIDKEIYNFYIKKITD